MLVPGGRLPTQRAWPDCFGVRRGAPGVVLAVVTDGGETFNIQSARRRTDECTCGCGGPTYQTHEVPILISSRPTHPQWSLSHHRAMRQTWSCVCADRPAARESVVSHTADQTGHSPAGLSTAPGPGPGPGLPPSGTAWGGSLHRNQR